MSKLKIYMKRILSIFSVVVILAVGLRYCNQLFIRKESYKKCEPFFNSNEEFDVLFLGSSHVKYGVSPLFLYKNYGIMSYNMGESGNYIPSNYYRLIEIFQLLQNEKRQLPKVIVMDIYTDQEITERLHRGWDDYSISVNKIKMTNELVNEQDRAEMLFPFSLYHNRWNELVKDDFQTEINRFYGLEHGRYEISYPENVIINNPSNQIEADTKTIAYLNQMREECEVIGVKLIFIQIPYSNRADFQCEANGICQYISEQGNLCVNYMNVDTGIDFDIDFYDTGHLNFAGMRVMTDELGKLLSEYGIKDHRDEPDTQQWEQAYEEYIDFRISKIKEIQDVKPYLMAINDPDLKSIVQIREGMLSDVQIAKLVKRLGGGRKSGYYNQRAV